MNQFSAVFISLSSFGAAEVGRHGQLWFARLAHEAGADGVEVRGELLRDLGGESGEVDDLAGGLRGMKLRVVYSSPEGMFGEDGELDTAAINRGLSIASRLGAARLKMSIGKFSPASIASLPVLKTQLNKSAIELVIENDQTDTAGTLGALRKFFRAADAAGLALPMTFDMGNWHWAGECPQQAASVFGSRVAYIHCKGVQHQAQRWAAVPMTRSSAAWRSILGALPNGLPCAIEYPLIGDDLLAVTQSEISSLRAIAAADAEETMQ
ncbi:sugar phosphate isomerase/epimerase family protein [Noviherbaspirillum malthae]|uniref:sugar phosphate isomerase/epimerase family protein n=1 Tax=Noviherbaspirillum malthae TaxID=1260987 RepID=UPI00188EF938|nr:TIM barrel protein [Noviherbaspirillum malthae]